jgi:hypothetical protein
MKLFSWVKRAWLESATVEVVTPPINTFVYCSLHFEATHCWPECPFEEVAYLRVPHRHMFHIVAYVPVHHDDRDVEFIMLKHKIEKYLRSTYPQHDFGSKSCEMIAKELIGQFSLSGCNVSEDGENGAMVTF